MISNHELRRLTQDLWEWVERLADETDLSNWQTPFAPRDLTMLQRRLVEEALISGPPWKLDTDE